MATSTSYWCYRCSRFVRVWPDDSIVCPGCDGGFLEEIESPPPPFPSGELRHRRYHHPSDLRFRRRNRGSGGDRSPFNPVTVLRGPSGADRAAVTSTFELYYDDGAGSGLQPLPASMSEFLMGSGFERLLDQLAQIEINGLGVGRDCDHPPASKSAVDSMPTISISNRHVGGDDSQWSHCAVCKEAFEVGAEAREMPCKHIYHQDCILPWLSLRNSCPVCRYEMPSEIGGGGSEGEEDAEGLTIWRLPGGGFAAGRFTGGRRGAAGERELPVVYTEMDGGFGSGSGGGQPRRVAWSERGGRSGARSRGGIRRAFRNFLLTFWRRRSGSGSESSSSSTRRSSSSSSSRVLRIYRGGGSQILQ